MEPFNTYFWWNITYSSFTGFSPVIFFKNTECNAAKINDLTTSLCASAQHVISARNHSITSPQICIFINPTSLPWIGIIPHRLAPLFIPSEAYTPIVDLSQLCRAHKLWLKRVDKHSGLLVWESGDLILCHYLAGPASRHLLVNAVPGNTEKNPALLRLERKRHTLVPLCRLHALH